MKRLFDCKKSNKRMEIAAETFLGASEQALETREIETCASDK